MKTPNTAGLIALLTAMSVGCGASAPVPPTTPAKPGAALPSAPPAEKAATAKQEPRPVKRERPAAERAKVAQLFQIPQVIRTGAANYNDVRQEGSAAPQIRLLGFSRIDGQLRALVQVKGETIPVEQGDVIDGAEVVAIDADGVSFQYGAQRWTSPLFEKPETRPVKIARAGSPAAAPPLPDVESKSPRPEPLPASSVEPTAPTDSTPPPSS